VPVVCGIAGARGTTVCVADAWKDRSVVSALVGKSARNLVNQIWPPARPANSAVMSSIARCGALFPIESA
jgi:hypothetical protein